MTLEEFQTIYRGDRKCYALWSHGGAEYHGLLLDGPKVSLAGVTFVPIESSANRVPLDLLVAVEVTDNSWVNDSRR